MYIVCCPIQVHHIIIWNCTWCPSNNWPHLEIRAAHHAIHQWLYGAIWWPWHPYHQGSVSLADGMVDGTVWCHMILYLYGHTWHVQLYLSHVLINVDLFIDHRYQQSSLILQRQTPCLHSLIHFTTWHWHGHGLQTLAPLASYLQYYRLLRAMGPPIFSYCWFGMHNCFY